MRTISVISVLALSIVRLLGQGFVEMNVTVGDTSFGMPVPASYVAIEKDAEWAKAYLQGKEHLFTDERRNNTFILAMQTPERFAVSKKKGEVTGGLDCWAVYPNFSAKSRMSLEQFATLSAQAESAFTKLDQTAKMSEFLGIKPSDFTDAQVSRQFATMTKPMIIGKSSRTLLTVAKDEVTYTVQAWVLVNGKFLFLYMNKSQDQLASGISEMHAWLKEIEDKTQATYGTRTMPVAPEKTTALAPLKAQSDTPDDGDEIAKKMVVLNYRAEAAKGDANAQGMLGFCYFFGKGVGKDLAKAVFWYRKAAEQGHAKGQYHLGNCYATGQGVTLDLTEAASWYRKAAEQGHDMAQVSLGNCYAQGMGVSADLVQANSWYRKAADQGSASAQLQLGDNYASGKGFTQDNFEAARWYRKAAEQGHSLAQYRLGDCYYFGKGVKKDLIQAGSWHRKSAEQGWVSSQLYLGLSYLSGDGVTKDITQAIYWFTKAAEQKDDHALFSLGYFYATGTGVVKDEVEAYAYWKLAGDNHEHAVKNLAMLEKGLSADQLKAGQKRAKELQKEIEAKIEAKKAGK